VYQRITDQDLYREDVKCEKRRFVVLSWGEEKGPTRKRGHSSSTGAQAFADSVLRI
jgi:hypothetical protein